MTTEPTCKRCGRPEAQGVGWDPVKTKSGWVRGYLHHECPEKVCKKTIHVAGSFHESNPCSKDSKGQTDGGEWFCGVHLAAYRKVQAGDLARKQRHGASDANQARAKLACDILTELGLDASVHYHSAARLNGSGFTGKVVLDPAELFKVLGIGAKLPDSEGIHAR